MTSSPPSPIWTPAPLLITLENPQVHIWRISLDPPTPLLHSFETTLNADELHRANRFRTPALRRKFLAGRGALRAILAAYLLRDPSTVTFAYESHGKPVIAGETTARLEFNLSHTADLALLALAQGRPLGVDVEERKPMDNAEKIISRFFSPREQADFLALPPADRNAAFFRAWTRKEAYLKAKGTGLSTQLDSFDVTLKPSESPALTRIGDDPAEPARWSLLDLHPGPGFPAALAVLGRVLPSDLRLFDADPWLTRTSTPQSD